MVVHIDDHVLAWPDVDAGDLVFGCSENVGAGSQLFGRFASAAEPGDIVLVCLARFVDIDQAADQVLDQDRPCGGRLDFDDTLLGRLGLGDEFHGGGHCLMQFRRTVGAQELAACIVGHALQLGLLFVVQVKADHVNGEVNAARLKFLCSGAGVRIARLQAVADEYDRGALLGVAERLGRLAHRLGQRCLALGADVFHRGHHRDAVHRADRDQRFDISAIALLAMTVGGDAELDGLVPVFHQVANDGLGDGDLGCIADPAPHAARTVQNKDRSCRRFRFSRNAGQGDRGGCN